MVPHSGGDLCVANLTLGINHHTGKNLSIYLFRSCSHQHFEDFAFFAILCSLLAVTGCLVWTEIWQREKRPRRAPQTCLLTGPLSWRIHTTFSVSPKFALG